MDGSSCRFKQIDMEFLSCQEAYNCVVTVF